MSREAQKREMSAQPPASLTAAKEARGVSVPLRPVLRWAGSKRRLLPLLRARVPQHFARYVEPFCGSAALFFELRPQRALLADINPELINFYVQLQRGFDFGNKLAQIPPTRESYYKIRNEPASMQSPEARALRFIFLNRLCFNGVYRTNTAGEFNVPMGTRTGSYPTVAEFLAVQGALQTASFSNTDYLETLETSGSGDFVYLDPPYFKSERKRGEYGPGAFDSRSLDKLVDELVQLDLRGAQFMLSYKADPLLVQRLGDLFDIEFIDARRHVSGFRAGWSVENEILVRNYA